jgi:predicted alpha/beta superfamily hydrolase
MNKTYKAAVVLPSSYAKSKTNYPVMYLLHGAYGHFDSWLSKTLIKFVASIVRSI